MKNIFTLIFIFFMFTNFGQKTLLVENFDYDAGAQLRDHGWTSHSAFETSPLLVSSEGLSMLSTAYAGNGIGNAALVINNGSDENKPFTSYVEQPNEGEAPKHTYASFLMKPNGEIPEATGTTRPYFFHFGMYSDTENPEFSSLSTAFRARTFIYPGTLPNTFRLNLSFNQNEPDGANITSNFNSNNVHLIVLKYTSIAGADNDEVSLYVFKDGDDISSEPTTPTIGPLKGTNMDVTLQAVALRQYQMDQNVIVDGIIVRDHWDLTSDPSSVRDNVFAPSLKIYPNPVNNNVVTIESSSQEPMKISITNIEGTPVLNNSSYDNSIDVSGLNSGVYILQINQNNKIQNHKLVIP